MTSPGQTCGKKSKCFTTLTAAFKFYMTDILPPRMKAVPGQQRAKRLRLGR